VKAVKLGAVDYLTKPADVDDIVSTLLAPNGARGEAPSHPMPAERVRWEHMSQHASANIAADFIAEQEFQVQWGTRLTGAMRRAAFIATVRMEVAPLHQCSYLTGG
jgi:ActR/RegA family two-component response regulator